MNCRRWPRKCVTRRLNSATSAIALGDGQRCASRPDSRRVCITFCLLVLCLTISAALVEASTLKVEQFVREDSVATKAPGEFIYCKGCMTDARKGREPIEQRRENPKMPRYAAANQVDFDEVSFKKKYILNLMLTLTKVPGELKGLNWIEKSLIQLTRPVRAVVCLNDIGGRKTTMQATTGTCSVFGFNKLNIFKFNLLVSAHFWLVLKHYVSFNCIEI